MVNLNIPGYWPPSSATEQPVLLGLQLLVYCGVIAAVVLVVVLLVRRAAKLDAAFAPVPAVQPRRHVDTCAAEPQSRSELVAAEREWARSL